jgi:hypothetical protein
METKYYTPERNEFHEGFIFEANYKKEGWQKEIFGIGERSISSVPQLLYQFLDGAPLEGNIRVKLLDREDIESLGWGKPTEGHFGYLIYTIKTYELQFFHGTPTFIEIDNSDEKFERFIGNVKNKSELQKIMQMLNIK